MQAMDRPAPAAAGQPAPNPRQRHQALPPGTGTFGMYLFLAALTMLFGASMLLYVLMRFGMFPPDSNPQPVGAPPWPLWVSTLVILASSYTVHRALDNLRHERQQPFRNALVHTLLLAVMFLLVQAPSLGLLLTEHFDQLGQRASTNGQTGIQLYGLVFFLILVHALHLVGGLVPLGVVTYKAHQGRYDHEHFGPVKYLAMYWHFLDGVWVIMFAMFLVVR